MNKGKKREGRRPEILLPQKGAECAVHSIPGQRQVTIIGGNGAGKSRFMEALAELNPGRTYRLSALSATFPEREESELPGSVDMQYRMVALRQPYLRSDAVCELDKLLYMVFADECEALLNEKQLISQGKNTKKSKPTRLDRIRNIWHRIFPGHSIVISQGVIMFTTESGTDHIDSSKLSQGEKTALYYAAAVLYAMPQALIFVESPSLFLHPSVMSTYWDLIEQLRPDCTFVYDCINVDFVTTRTDNCCIWIKSYDSTRNFWDYQILSDNELTEDIFIEMAGSRRPVLFIEGDERHSIDAKLYGLVFSGWNIRAMGSCNKVIETTRTFNDLKNMHHLKSRGIVDRDRRTDVEVAYLRNKEIMVSDVAEVENMFLLEPVMRIMARRRGRSPEMVVSRVKKEVLHIFRQQAEQQTLQHVRHIVKRQVECKIDAKFQCITAMETHLKTLIDKLQPRKHYNELRECFARMIVEKDYAAILKVFNHKPMLSNCGVHQLLGYHSVDDYINGVLEALRENGKDAAGIKHCIVSSFHVAEDI